MLRMKKIDKLVFGSFIGPFLLTLIVVDFILLLVTLLKYFDQIMGKGLSFSIFGELITYFSISASPDAFPLAVLLSSIMTFGNLGEHSELTAVKSSGISLIRSLASIFIFVLFLTGFTYYSNTVLVPKTNLKTYSLLWDMRTKKPALDIKQGVFYGGIPGYSIKVNEKVDDERLRDIIIYDHTNRDARGNKEVIIADSGRMYSFMNQRYLALELYNGIKYAESGNENYREKLDGGQFIRNKFTESKIIFDLSSFDMGDTDEKLFRRSRLVQTRSDLKLGIDSMSLDILNARNRLFRDVGNSFQFHSVKSVGLPEELETERAFNDSIRTSRRKRAAIVNAQSDTAINSSPQYAGLGNSELLQNKKVVSERTLSKNLKRDQVKITPKEELPKVLTEAEILEKIDQYYDSKIRKTSIMNTAVSNARSNTATFNASISTIDTIERDRDKFKVTRSQQIARSFACLIMFLIGAPIGAIIKKGGLGLPVIVSVIFFLIFYTLNTMGDKWGKQGIVDPILAMWMSNIILFPFGMFFLRQARNDARLFEADFYVAFWERTKKRFAKKKQLKTA
uniref:LptF/LptG family permease n=3 Tax=Roseivirga sp. TaxID=1964215 RepID=UPI0040473D22